MGNRSLAILFLFFFAIDYSYSSSCCGGGNNAPLVMTKETAAMITMLTKHSAITHYADANSKITTRNKIYNSVINSTDLSGILSINQNTQISGLITYTNRKNTTVLNKESSHGINKLIFQVNYEFLPEYLYSRWRPRGFIFVNIDHPLSKSIFESKKTLQTDAISDPQTSSSVGILFKKNLNYFDFLTSTSISLYFPKDLNWNNKKLTASELFKFNHLIDIGVSLPESNFRFGLSLNYVHKSKNTLRQFGQVNESYLLSFGLNGSYEFNKFILGLNYTDQSYLFIAKNNSLTKSVALSISRPFY
jgi:hypothetical protein